ncbi:class I SAM-dependent methyltransferase [Burkholderia ubonensis]|uniref:class I SAM-dependent methyltransferase n=1 Tax=Burkholderia ubonensis TaxID=101571 RepID=UPI0009B425E4|nr:methyltransferase domain-containing protein [Burkholderia ubonensis]
MKEATKTNKIRSSDFFDKYLKGRVIDIGAGGDTVCDWALDFDFSQGDANHIDRYFPPESFDAVHSSHCLEHMNDPISALTGWWSLVKPGGYMITVVPDELLYEQGIWPSFFNDDHKSTFRLGGDIGLTSVSHDIKVIHENLPHAEVVSAKIQDDGYNREIIFTNEIPPRRLRHPIKLLSSIAKRVARDGSPAKVAFNKWLTSMGYPVDQTNEGALAQIEVITRKALSSQADGADSQPRT